MPDIICTCIYIYMLSITYIHLSEALYHTAVSYPLSWGCYLDSHWTFAGWTLVSLLWRREEQCSLRGCAAHRSLNQHSRNSASLFGRDRVLPPQRPYLDIWGIPARRFPRVHGKRTPMTPQTRSDQYMPLAGLVPKVRLVGCIRYEQLSYYH